MTGDHLYIIRCNDGTMAEIRTCDVGCASLRVYTDLAMARRDAKELDEDYADQLRLNPGRAADWLEEGFYCCVGPHRVSEFSEDL